MTIYAIFIDEPNPEAWRKIKDFWGRRSYFLTANLAFVAARASALTEKTADRP